MCGIAAFVGNRVWMRSADSTWLRELREELARAAAFSPAGEGSSADDLAVALEGLPRHFGKLMSFGLHAAARDDRRVRCELEELAAALSSLAERVADPDSTLRARADVDRLLEKARDYHWQIAHEVLGNLARTERLLPEGLRGRPAEGADRARVHLAWAIEQVLENVERLEVRGRDSAGVNVLLELAPGPELDAVQADGAFDALEERGASGPSTVRLRRAPGGGLVASFLYKVASVVGRLGDNTERLREMLRADQHLWALARALERANVVAHTRWASNGIINVPNCHPIDAALAGEDGGLELEERDLWYVLNGDVDNCAALQVELAARGFALDPRVTTDAKLLPLLHRLDTDRESSPVERFCAVLSRCQGSLAVALQDPARPAELLLGLKGSGQGLYAADTPDGWIVSSESYGLAARARVAIPLSGREQGGTMLHLRAGERERGMKDFRSSHEPGKLEPDLSDVSKGSSEALHLRDGSRAELAPLPIEIFSRDIFRGEHPHFLHKELCEAPESIRKTLRGKYERKDDAVEFLASGPHSFGALLRRLRDRKARAFDEVLAIGQGTASIAAMGAAHLIERAVGERGLRVRWAKASEVSGFGSERALEGMLVVAISQSGTTTDTNRTVDLLAARGAWVHAIVNRRDSPLVRRSDSHTYTSDGRDVEMAVASTKAFYSQIAAAKLLALLLGRELGTLSERALLGELRDLESLADKVQTVLDSSAEIGAVAARYAPYQANWALVGNGANKIAAEEVRIKISELCYKSIPCDFTEDKKHIDLSTEPLTLVMASDLPEAVVQDTCKEVAIFKAHGGRPIVVATSGEDRFDASSERVLHVPAIGAHLSFVLETVVGHLFGYHAALAIDRGSAALRELRARLSEVLDAHGAGEAAVIEPWDRIEAEIAEGAMDAALRPRTLATLARLRRRYEAALSSGSVPSELLAECIAVLTVAVEETARPIDSIRHQAKTVTVGLSRPQEELALPVVETLRALGFAPEALGAHDAQELCAVAPLVAGVEGALVYEVLQGELHDGLPRLHAGKRIGTCGGRGSRYDSPQPAAGMKRKVLRLGRGAFGSGRESAENLLLLPLAGEGGTRPQNLVLMHLSFVERAPAPQKLGVLKRLEHRYDELVEALEERDELARLELLVESLSPRDLVLSPTSELAARATERVPPPVG